MEITTQKEVFGNRFFLRSKNRNSIAVQPDL